MDHAHRGEAALSKSDFTAAINHYTLALQASPEAATYYIKRATAYQRTSQFDLALADAEKAVSLATKRAKRELIAQAQLRRGTALFQLGQYANSKFCLQQTKRFDDKEKSADMWIAKCDGKLKTLDEGDAAATVTVQEVPDVTIEKPKKAPDSKQGAPGTEHTSGSTAAPVSTAPSQTPLDKIRHEWYQSNESVTINLLAKGVPKDQATVEIQPTTVSVSFPLQTGSTYDFSLEPLFAAVDTEGSKYRVLSTKIEITLKKSTPGQKWANLEGSEASPTLTQSKNAATPSPNATPAGPAYPTSSRSGPKNWDKIAQSYQKPPPKPKKDVDKDKDKQKDKDGDESSDEKEDDMYIDDADDGGDPANAFFKKLYAGADPDTRRAMMKSYQESGGTALSTNWNEVGKKKVEVSPPEGMEERKYEI